MPEKWTNRSRPPSAGVMKPYPLSSLNHLTVPIAIWQEPPRSSGLRLRRLLVQRPERDTIQPAQSRLLRDETLPRRRRDQRVAAAGRSAVEQLVRGALDRVQVALLRDPRQLQRIVVVARDHVDVEVED